MARPSLRLILRWGGPMLRTRPHSASKTRVTALMGALLSMRPDKRLRPNPSHLLRTRWRIAFTDNMRASTSCGSAGMQTLRQCAGSPSHVFVRRQRAR